MEIINQITEIYLTNYDRIEASLSLVATKSCDLYVEKVMNPASIVLVSFVCILIVLIMERKKPDYDRMMYFIGLSIILCVPITMMVLLMPIFIYVICTFLFFLLFWLSYVLILFLVPIAVLMVVWKLLYSKSNKIKKRL